MRYGDGGEFCGLNPRIYEKESVGVAAGFLFDEEDVSLGNFGVKNDSEEFA